VSSLSQSAQEGKPTRTEWQIFSLSTTAYISVYNFLSTSTSSSSLYITAVKVYLMLSSLLFFHMVWASQHKASYDTHVGFRYTKVNRSDDGKTYECRFGGTSKRWTLQIFRKILI